MIIASILNEQSIWVPNNQTFLSQFNANNLGTPRPTIYGKRIYLIELIDKNNWYGTTRPLVQTEQTLGIGRPNGYL